MLGKKNIWFSFKNGYSNQDNEITVSIPLSVLPVPQFMGINILFAIDNSGPVYVQSLSCLVQTSSEYEQQGVLSPNCSNTCLMHLLVISNFWLLKIA